MVKQLLVGSMLLVFAAPSLAAKTVYLKEGSTIRAKSAWQSKGKVHVFVNRDTLAEFANSEVDLKKTFPRKHRRAPKPVAAAEPIKKEMVAVPGAADSSKPVSSGVGLQLTGLPKLTDKKPESLLPKGGEGTIRKHKKEMADKVGE